MRLPLCVVLLSLARPVQYSPSNTLLRLQHVQHTLFVVTAAVLLVVAVVVVVVVVVLVAAV